MAAKKLTKEEAKAKIDAHVAEAYAELEKAVVIADKYGVDFHFDGPGDSYGMGGYYEAADADWEPSNCEWEQSNPRPVGSWNSSSSSC